MNKSKLLAPLFFVVALLCLVSFAVPSAEAANLVQNGGFESTSLSSPGGYFCSNSASNTCISNVTSWNSVCRNGSCGNGATPTSLIFPSTGGSAFNSGIGLQTASTNSPDGGNYVAADADSVYNSAIFQTINGLTTGTNYTLTFYQASDQQSGNTSPFTAQWQVTLGASTQLSQVMSNTGGQFTNWSKQTLNFQAGGTSQLLSFLAMSPSGAPPVALLDGVSLTPTATPEVSTSYLAFSAFVGLALFARFRQRRNNTTA